MTAIVTDGLKSDGDETVIEVAPAADDICGPCPKRRGMLCTKQTKIEGLDRAHLDALGLKIGDRLTWAQAKSRIRERVLPGDLSGLCNGCEWLKLGLCEAALEELHATP
ncbi:DUF1284 domain-containing protein [Qingshengfaniella alkalisoli]|uniref:DUF1284 domain-containing protein n=2 Tax=Qingshengfaniella alkalisoli TaxID=2599296 RepID=A0A5B8IWY8_9RHOB|nr:DUF1284 domain-containing protein [Qingshengfaniella alkalisoli]